MQETPIYAELLSEFALRDDRPADPAPDPEEPAPDGADPS